MLSASASLAEPQEILVQTAQTFADARASDPAAIASVGEKLLKLEEQRKRWTEDAADKVRALTYRLELARARAVRPSSATTPEDHALLVARLKGELLAAEQRVEDQETALAEAEARLERAAEEEEAVRAAKEDEEAGGADAADPVILKLEIYRSLGMELLTPDPEPGTEPSPDEPVVFHRALVRSKQALHSVELHAPTDPADEFAKVNQLWSLLGE
ncbi:hypothetical protein DFJ74DRAFT_766301 [Hyaloraphidium curvatum]|nr:hypothetical protein DFJ74DRAFT_766301 [Hyaloraphidium curvatum]